MMWAVMTITVQDHRASEAIEAKVKAHLLELVWLAH